MGDDEVDERFALAAESNRGFGDIPLRSEAAVSPFSRATMDAASNLLKEARRCGMATASGRGAWSSAPSLSLTTRSRRSPGDVAGAHGHVHGGHRCSRGGRRRQGLDAVVDTLTAAAEEARFTLRDCVVDLLQDYDLSGVDRRLRRGAVAEVPAQAGLDERDLAPHERSAAILDLLAGVALYEDSYAERSALSAAERYEIGIPW